VFVHGKVFKAIVSLYTLIPICSFLEKPRSFFRVCSEQNIDLINIYSVGTHDFGLGIPADVKNKYYFNIFIKKKILLKITFTKFLSGHFVRS
jgi:hypothetical protein